MPAPLLLSNDATTLPSTRTTKLSRGSHESMAMATIRSRTMVCGGRSDRRSDTEASPPSSPKPPKTLLPPHTVVAAPVHPSTPPLKVELYAVVAKSSGHDDAVGDGVLLTGDGVGDALADMLGERDAVGDGVPLEDCDSDNDGVSDGDVEYDGVGETHSPLLLTCTVTMLTPTASSNKLSSSID
jgi:hypothetical protein